MNSVAHPPSPVHRSASLSFYPRVVCFSPHIWPSPRELGVDYLGQSPKIPQKSGAPYSRPDATEHTYRLTYRTGRQFRHRDPRPFPAPCPRSLPNRFDREGLLSVDGFSHPCRRSCAMFESYSTQSVPIVLIARTGATTFSLTLLAWDEDGTDRREAGANRLLCGTDVQWSCKPQWERPIRTSPVITAHDQNRNQPRSGRIGKSCSSHSWIGRNGLPEVTLVGRPGTIHDTFGETE